MAQRKDRRAVRQRIHLRVRRRVSGTPARPRLVVFRSLSHVYAQIVDDTQGVTLASTSTQSKAVSDRANLAANAAGAKRIGAVAAEVAKGVGITAVVFDRSGAKYHGKVKALADAAREAGLKF